MFRITPKEEKFFDLFVDTAADTCQAARLLEDLMINYVNVREKIDAVENMEHKCDSHVHKMLELLNRSFITPIDREDIYLIAKEIDNITDSIEATAHRFFMYNVTYVRDEAKQLASMISKCTEELNYVMLELKNMKTSKLLQEKIIEVNRIEDSGDVVFRNAIQKLFSAEKDPMEVIRWKEIYEFMENTLDACEDVANIIEGVVMKHA